MRNEVAISKLNGNDSVQTVYRNGAVYCSLISDKDSKEVKTITPKGEILKGDAVKITYKELRKQVLAGNEVYSKAGQSIPCTQRAAKTPDKEVKVVITKEGTINKYQII